VKAPLAVESEIAYGGRAIIVWADPTAVAVPPPVAVPDTWPPKNLKDCNFLDPLR
jgi:hypothetical protein